MKRCKTTVKKVSIRSSSIDLYAWWCTCGKGATGYFTKDGARIDAELHERK